MSNCLQVEVLLSVELTFQYHSIPEVRFETLFRLSMSLNLSGACGVVSGDDDDSSRRFGTRS